MNKSTVCSKGTDRIEIVFKSWKLIFILWNIKNKNNWAVENLKLSNIGGRNHSNTISIESEITKTSEKLKQFNWVSVVNMNVKNQRLIVIPQ